MLNGQVEEDETKEQLRVEEEPGERRRILEGRGGNISE